MPGSGPIDHVSLAPTGDAWVTIRNRQAWISTLERSAAGWSATSTLLAIELGQHALGAATGVAIELGYPAPTCPRLVLAPTAMSAS